jgi:hypothetical protein
MVIAGDFYSKWLLAEIFRVKNVVLLTRVPALSQVAVR